MSHNSDGPQDPYGGSPGNNCSVTPLNRLCEQLAHQIATLRRPALVAVDGVDGAGKTTFASHLGSAIGRAGRTPVIVHEDDFLAPRAVRYRLGRDSPEGFFRDSYDLSALRRHVLDALRPGGHRRIRPRAFDHRADSPVDVAEHEVPLDAVVIVEGLFLHRDELADQWDWSVFLDVPFTETARRLAHRDGSEPDPDHPTMRRYVEGQRIYLASCRPHERASVVVDNTEPTYPPG